MAPDSGSVEEAVAFLQKSSSTAGTSVFDHLTNVVHRILEERPANAVDILETSLLVKKTAPPQLKEMVPRKSGPDAAALAAAAATAQLYSTPEPRISPETGEAEEAEPLNEYEADNWVADSALFAAVGVGLGRCETYAVALALHKLGQNPAKNVASARFFGKLFGTAANYYVFETTLKGEEEEKSEEEVAAEEAVMWGRPQDGVPKEERSGTNAAVYWVATRLGGDFTRLPDVTPLQIRTARSIKKFLTGDLKAEVSAYPPFPGVEAHFLRAQLARIAGTTVVCPAGYFTAGEEEGALEKNEEYAPAASAADLTGLEAWAHRNPHVKKQGRCAVYVAPPPEDAEEGEEEEHQPTEEESEESPAPLTTLDNDAELPTGGKPWAVALSSDIPGLKHKVACVRSLLWPGAYALATPSGFSNVYIGWGVKNAPYSPPSPPEVQIEYEPAEGEAALVESTELPPKPEPEVPETPNGEEGEEGEDDEEEGDEDEDGDEEEEEEDEEDE